MTDLRFFEELDAEFERVAGQPSRPQPTGRGLRVGVVGVTAAVVVIVGVAVMSGASRRASVIARSYAATSSSGGILSYKTTFYTPGEDRPDQYAARIRYQASIWTSGNTVRAVENQVIGGAPGHPAFRLFVEDVLSGHHLTDWEGAPTDRTGTTTETTTPRTCTATGALTSLSCGSPIQAIRALYKSGALHQTGTTTYDGQKVDVLTERSAGPPTNGTGKPMVLLTRILVNAATLIPMQVHVTSTNYSSTLTFSDFTRLPLTARNRKLLQLSPHPGAPIKQLPAGGMVITTPTSRTSTITTLQTIQLTTEHHETSKQHERGSADVVQQNGRKRVVVFATKVPRLPAGASYGLWLLNTTTRTTTLAGYFTNQPDRGVLEQEFRLPSHLGKHSTEIELAIPAPAQPRRPGEIILYGALR